MKFEIKHRWSGSILFSIETDSIKLAVEAAIKSKANLSEAKADYWVVLSSQPKEVEGLLLALKEGRVDGSTYHGDCACLVGTIANIAHCTYDALPNLKPDSDRAAEIFFFMIREGDTPENNQGCKLAYEWGREWLTNMKLAFGTKQ